MAASERIKFFIQSIGGKNESQNHSSVVALIFAECEVNVKQIGAQIFNNYMSKEPTEVSFFAIQANFCFIVTNFTEEKFDRDP